MGFGLDTDGAHGPNEHFHVERYHKGIETIIHFYSAYADLFAAGR
jgi:acetylornithine deacetylase/succinyl-diaminopimelate desuccinylase-like protein